MNAPLRLGVGNAPLVSGVRRLHLCGRCERLADDERQAGRHVPPVSSAESWVSSGIRYWSGLCHACADLDRKQRAARASAP